MPNRLAPPSQNALLTSIPAPYSASTFVPAPTRFNALREAENLSIGLGRGFTAGLEGTKQLLTQPVATARALVEAARQVGTDPRIVLDMLRAARQKAMSGSLGLGELIGENLTPGMRGRRIPVMRELDVYHGTPHRFPATETNPLGEFDASKIGTGEGAQAYGHGVYLAESPEIAKIYSTVDRPMLQRLPVKNGKIYEAKTLAEFKASNILQATGDYEKALARIEADMERLRSNVRSLPSNRLGQSFVEIEDNIARELQELQQAKSALLNMRENGVLVGPDYSPSLYKADLPDEMIDRMLDWDKPLSEQPAAVRNAFNDLLDETGNYQSSGIGGIGNLSGSDAADLYNDLKGMWNENYGPDDLVNIDAPSASAAVSEFLRRRGIPGIKYLDAGSRGQGGSGTRNFVVFPGEEKKVRIFERK